MAARFAAHRLRRIHPFEVQASLLTSCNLRCTYCRCPDVKMPTLSTDQWKIVLRDLAALGTLRIKFQGGEPTMRPDFEELCAEAQAGGILTAVVTNGTRIPSNPALLDHLDEVVVSLDSPRPEANDRIRGEGVHANVMRTIDLAVERRVRVFINMVVTRQTLGDVEAMLDLCESRGIGLNAQPAMFGKKYYDDNAREFGLTTDEIRALQARLAGLKDQGRRLMFAASSYRKAVTWPDPNVLTERSAQPSSCMAGRDYFHIEPNGDVHPCGYHGATYTPKNVVRDGLRQALLHAGRHDCGDCWIPYLNERKLIFSLRPRALLEFARRAAAPGGAARPAASDRR